MKKVITTTKETISLSDITDYVIVGIKWDNVDKSFILYNNKGFYAIALKDISIEGKWYTNSKKEYVKSVIEEQGAKVFVFETYGELFNWLKE